VWKNWNRNRLVNKGANQRNDGKAQRRQETLQKRVRKKKKQS
jgi:hypothetical protein